PQGKEEARLELGLEIRERFDVQRLFVQRRAKLNSAFGIVRCQGEAPAHRGNGDDGVPRAADLQHWRNRLRPVGQTGDRDSLRPVQLELAGRQHSRAELVLESLDADSVELAV